jgi:NAD(P)-dependent dehydrogenase (short-subunit alcohol dehydrogenase family)
MEEIVKAQQLFDLSGQVAFITGASSGLGARFARVLAAHGASVVLAARRLERLKSITAEIADGGGRAQALKLDVSDPEAVARALDQAETQFGAMSLLVNNAGVARPARALEMDAADWYTVLNTNLNAVWLIAQEAGRRMAKGRGGAIINVASILGMRVEPGQAAYSAAKAGVIQLTRTLAVELARHNIRVNAIAPGYIMSEMTSAYLRSPKGEEMIKAVPQRRAGDPSDLDGTLLLLASPTASGFMTGATIVVDGGNMWAY